MSHPCIKLGHVLCHVSHNSQGGRTQYRALRHSYYQSYDPASRELSPGTVRANGNFGNIFIERRLKL
jgi:hypothetical protein